MGVGVGTGTSYEQPFGHARGDAGGARRLALEEWFAARRRPFPWRTGLGAWGTFLAEMLLRRTRAQQVAQHLPDVLERYPHALALAAASEADVEEALRPFGLYWRARTLHAAAGIIARDFNGRVPTEFDQLVRLPGVGPYVAAATLAAVMKRDVCLIDTNTVRVATRVVGIYRPGDIRRQRDVQDAVAELVSGNAPARVWWAVIDLAATTCTPRSPACPSCPLQPWCATGRGPNQAG